VEQNRDAQLRMLLIAEEVVRPEALVSVRRYGGLPLSATDVVESIRDFLARGASSLPAAS
jgi:hypothetical protein